MAILRKATLHDLYTLGLSGALRRTPRYYGECDVCGNPYLAGRRDKRFCSTACRQRAYRLRRDPKAVSGRSAAARKAAATKRDKVEAVTCRVCGRVVMRDGNSAPRAMYCSNACKQNAYRARRGL